MKLVPLVPCARTAADDHLVNVCDVLERVLPWRHRPMLRIAVEDDGGGVGFVQFWTSDTRVGVWHDGQHVGFLPRARLFDWLSDPIPGSELVGQAVRFTSRTRHTMTLTLPGVTAWTVPTSQLAELRYRVRP